MKFFKYLTVTAMGASLMLIAPPQEAKAGGAGTFLGGVAVGAAGAVIGHKIYKHQKRKKARRYQEETRTYNRSVISQEQLAANADIQNRLNVLGHDAGVADGIMGRRTRAAIRSFQAANAQPITGSLNNQEIALLYQQSEPLLTGRASGGALTAATGGATGGTVYATTPLNSNEAVASSLSSDTDLTGDLLELDEKPRVLGIAVGEPFNGTLAKLKQDGFAACESSAVALSCQKTTGIGSDVITVSSSNGSIHTITRSLSFNNPIARSKVVSRLPASYGPLLESETNTVASSPACNALLVAQPESFDTISQQSQAGGQFDASTTAFAHACKYYYTMVMADTATVSSVGLVFFDSNPILAALANGTATTAQSGGDGEIKF